MKSFITDKWDEYLDCFNDASKDIYYLEEYVRLYENENEKALCALCIDEEKVLLFPFLRKEIGDFYDFETAYGYGGPISNTSEVVWINQAGKEMEELFRINNYICGFVRFHTLLDNAVVCKDYINVIFDRKTIAMDLNESEEQIWANQISSKNRNMIRKAKKNLLEYKAEYDFESLEEFVGLYLSTMKRLNAEEFYFFDEQYFKQFVKSFQGKSFLGTVRKDGVLVCGALFMYSKEYGHYHLEGSNHEYSGLAANNLLLWETALELQRLGVKEFHLGGGYNSEPENSLYKFKAAFSNLNKDFCIGKWIFNKEQYSKTKEEWMINNPDKADKYGKLLLCYRY